MIKQEEQIFQLDSLSGLELLNVKAEPVIYLDRQAIRIIEQGERTSLEHALAILSFSDFKDGVIETSIAGILREDAQKDMRGFIGIAFRVQPHGSKFECFFLRPTNARANDQLRRNHSTQYISHPDFPWYRLRDESPGVYESYADLIPGDWTSIRISVSDIQAKLYVNNANQPCLVVNDLKLGNIKGQLALWIGTGTEAYFSPIVVKEF